MQFQVPQFIETEAKIIGPLSLRQFLYLAAAGGVSALFFFLFQFWLWIFATIIVLGAAGGVAFVKVNGRPLMRLIRSVVKYAWEPKFYLWKREEKPQAAELPELPSVKTPGGSPLQNLILKLTTSTQTITKRELPNPFAFLKSETAKEKLEVLRKSTGEREATRRVDYR